MTSRRVTRIAFGVIIVFVLAQVVWWLIFQERYISGVTETTLAELAAGRGGGQCAFRTISRR